MATEEEKAKLKDVPQFLDKLTDFETTVSHGGVPAHYITCTLDVICLCVCRQIPDEVVQYYMDRTGCQCSDPKV